MISLGIQIIPALAAGLWGFFTGSKYSCDTWACLIKSNRWGRLVYFAAIGFICGRLFVDTDPFNWF